MPDTCIIIPCFNEAERLDVREFTSFVAASRGITFQFVDDGSQDETLAVLHRLEAECGPAVSVHALAKNAGKAEAVRVGLQRAMEAGFEFVGFWDADLATPLEAIPSFERVLLDRHDVQVVIGSRMPLLGRKIERHPMRSLCGRLFATAASTALGMRVYDTQCGAKLFRVTESMRRWVEVPFLSRWIFDVEIFARMDSLHRTGAEDCASIRSTIYELPLDHWHDVAGSKLRGRDFLRAVGELTQIFWRYRMSSSASWALQPLSNAAAESSSHVMVHPFEVSRVKGNDLRRKESRDTTTIRPRRAA